MLFGNAKAPMTSVIGFVRAPIDLAANYLRGWRDSLHHGAELVDSPADFAGSIDRLQPLVMGGVSRELVVGTNSSWTAIFDNSYTGGALSSTVSHLARALGTHGVAIVSIPQDEYGQRVRWGARQFEMFGPIATDFVNFVRTISVVNEGGRWRFDANGTVQDFEDVTAYRRRRVADRLTNEMLEKYARALGIDPFSEAYYTGPSVLIDAPRPELERIGLSDARKRLGISS